MVARRSFRQPHAPVQCRPTPSPSKPAAVVAHDHRRRHIRTPDARTAPERVPEAVAEFVIHPAVNDGVIAAVAHRQPVASDPDRLDVAEPVDDNRYSSLL